MPLFKINGENAATKLVYNSFKKEKDVQSLFENNMEEMLGMRFLKSEHKTTNGYIDSLAIDDKGNPVIVEYKLSKNESVLSQGLFYMNWLVNHRGDFEVLVQKTLGTDFKVSWNNPKLVIIASDYSRYDKDAVNEVKKDISLYKYYLYDNNLFYFERINTESSSDKERKPIPSDGTVTEYTLESLQSKASEEVIEMYNKLRGCILALDDSITEKITSTYVAFRASRNFAEINFQKKLVQCQLLLMPEEDPKKIGRRFPDTYRWTLNYRVDIKKQSEIDDVMELIEKSYNKTK